MADIVEIPLFHIGDATVLANKAKVDASGNLYTAITILPALPTGANVIGSISNTGFNVNNFPATQAVSGTISVGNFPTSFQVSNFPATQNIAITGVGATLGSPMFSQLTAGAAVIGSISNTAFGITGAIPAGTNVIGHVIADTGSTTAVTALPALPTGANSIGTVGLNAGLAIVGKFGIDQTTPGTT